jgi:hypothetical protein
VIFIKLNIKNKVENFWVLFSDTNFITHFYLTILVVKIWCLKIKKNVSMLYKMNKKKFQNLDREKFENTLISHFINRKIAFRGVFKMS